MHMMSKCWLMVVTGLQNHSSKIWVIDSQTAKLKSQTQRLICQHQQPTTQYTTISATHNNLHTSNCWDNHRLVGWPTVSPQVVVKNFLRSVGVRVIPNPMKVHQVARHLHKLEGGPPIQKLSPPYVVCQHHHIHPGCVWHFDIQH